MSEKTERAGRGEGLADRLTESIWAISDGQHPDKDTLRNLIRNILAAAPAGTAPRNIQMYQDLALASMVVDRDEKQALETLQLAVWWYHRMNALRGVCTDAVEESPEKRESVSGTVTDEQGVTST